MRLWLLDLQHSQKEMQNPRELSSKYVPSPYVTIQITEEDSKLENIEFKIREVLRKLPGVDEISWERRTVFSVDYNPGFYLFEYYLTH